MPQVGISQCRWYNYTSLNRVKRNILTLKIGGGIAGTVCGTEQGASFLGYLRPARMLFPPLTVHVAFGEPFSLAKLVRLVAIPRTEAILG